MPANNLKTNYDEIIITSPHPMYSPMHRKPNQVGKESETVSIKGMLYALLGVISYSFCGPLVKMCYKIEPNISSYEILYWNSLAQIVMTFCISHFIYNTFAFEVPPKYHLLILLRGTLGFFSILAVYASVKLMPLSIATCFSYTAPLFVSVIAWLAIGEKL